MFKLIAAISEECQQTLHQSTALLELNISSFDRRTIWPAVQSENSCRTLSDIQRHLLHLMSTSGSKVDRIESVTKDFL